MPASRKQLGRRLCGSQRCLARSLQRQRPAGARARPASPPVPALAKRMSNAHAGEAAPVSPQPPRASAAAARAAVAKSAPAAAAAPVIVQAHAEYSMVAAFPPETPLPRMGLLTLPASCNLPTSLCCKT